MTRKKPPFIFGSCQVGKHQNGFKGCIGTYTHAGGQVVRCECPCHGEGEQ